MQSTASISINSQIHSRIYWNLLLSLKIKSLSMILISSFLVIKLLVLLFTQIMTITNKISNFITTLFPLLLVYIGRPLFHILLDAYKVLLIPLRCYQWPRSRRVFLPVEACRCFPWLGPKLCSLSAARLSRDSDLDPITRPGQVPSLFNSQQITWWNNDAHSLSSHWAQHPVSAPQLRPVSHLTWPVFATLHTLLWK